MSEEKGAELTTEVTVEKISVTVTQGEQQEAGASSAPHDSIPGTSKADSAPEKKKGKGHTLPNLYDKFVTSFESAIDSIVGSGERDARQILPSLTIEGVAELIRDNKVRNIIVMCGAGISTSAGVPDFRSPGTGLYDNLTEYKLPDPLAIFEINFFRRNPEPFFKLAKRLFPETLKPTPCHYFIRLLDEKGLLKRCFTQNIDALEYLAGLPDEKIVTAHGSHRTSKCMSCRKNYSLEWMKEKLDDETCKVPLCDNCNGVVKPDIVFFGENLPKRFFTCAVSDFPKCDLLIIMGTSLVVQPFAGMVNEVRDEVPRLLINLTEAGRRGLRERMMLGSPGLNYGHKNNYRDVFWQGTCDDGAMKLAELLGWKKELNDLIEREWAAIDRKNQSVADTEGVTLEEVLKAGGTMP